MIDDTTFYKNVISEMKSCFLEMASIKIQREFWLYSPKRWFDSYAELMCTLYDDCDFKGFIKWLIKNKANENLIKILQEMDYKLEIFSAYENAENNDEEILNDPAWLKVVDYAKSVVNVLQDLHL